MNHNILNRREVGFPRESKDPWELWGRDFHAPEFIILSASPDQENGGVCWVEDCVVVASLLVIKDEIVSNQMNNFRFTAHNIRLLNWNYTTAHTSLWKCCLHDLDMNMNHYMNHSRVFISRRQATELKQRRYSSFLCSCCLLSKSEPSCCCEDQGRSDTGRAPFHTSTFVVLPLIHYYFIQE